MPKPKGSYVSWRKQKRNSYKLICYMTNWAQYRPNNTKYTPSNMDPFLCTHLIYAFAAINTTTYEIKSFEWNDESKKNFIGNSQIYLFCHSNPYHKKYFFVLPKTTRSLRRAEQFKKEKSQVKNTPRRRRFVLSYNFFV